MILTMWQHEGLSISMVLGWAGLGCLGWAGLAQIRIRITNNQHFLRVAATSPAQRPESNYWRWAEVGWAGLGGTFPLSSVSAAGWSGGQTGARGRSAAACSQHPALQLATAGPHPDPTPWSTSFVKFEVVQWRRRPLLGTSMQRS